MMNVAKQHLLKKEICLDYFKDMTLEEQNAVVWIATALQRAKDLHPKFAHGSLAYCASIVAEESGEYTRATNRFLYRDGPFENMIDEVAQVGATAVRALVMLQKKRKVAWKLRKKKPVPLKEK